MRLYILGLAALLSLFPRVAGAQTWAASTALAADAAAETALPAVRALPAPVIAPKVEGGGKTLPMLQAGMVALQVMDLVSTRQALSRPGAYEANPAFGSASGSLPVSIALKAGATAGIILLTNRAAKTNRVAAIVTMVALNSAYATITAHNFAIAHGH